FSGRRCESGALYLRHPDAAQNTDRCANMVRKSVPRTDQVRDNGAQLQPCTADGVSTGVSAARQRWHSFCCPCSVNNEPAGALQSAPFPGPGLTHIRVTIPSGEQHVESDPTDQRI